MTSVGWDSDTVTSTGPEDWVAALSTPGPEQAEAMRRLHQLLLRAARGQVQRMPAMLGGGGPALVEELANQAADEAMMAVLAKLGTFEGRSRFTTWAYKFAILQAATDVRRRFWRDRHLPFEGLELIPDPGASCVQYVEAADLASGLAGAADPAEYIADNLTLGTAVNLAATNPQGVAVSGALPIGLYLVREVSQPANVVAPAAPFLVTVPLPPLEAGDGWNYAIHVYPKNAVADAPVKSLDTTGAYALGSTVT